VKCKRKVREGERTHEISNDDYFTTFLDQVTNSAIYHQVEIVLEDETLIIRFVRTIAVSRREN